MEAPKSYESNGCQYDLVYSNSTRDMTSLNEAIVSANKIGLYTMVIPQTTKSSFKENIYGLYFYNRSRIEATK